MNKKSKDPQGRKWCAVLHNLEKEGLTRERIKELLQTLKSLVYWCVSDEIGLEEQTPHTHLYIHCSSSIRFSTLKNLFPTAHLERAQGSAQENRDYISKEGKWADSDKAKTNITGSFEESSNTLPIEHTGGRNLDAAIISRILDGASNSEILLEFNDLRILRDVEYARQTMREEEFRRKSRNIAVTYVTGPTGVGKSYNLMNGNDLGDIYRVTDYNHPWDFYAGQGTVILEEFSSSLKIGEMLNVLDIYPLTLRARYSNKIAMFSKVFIVSNLDLFEQYQNVQHEQPEVFRAFLRRIHKIVVYTAYQQFKEYSMEEYKAISRSYRNAKVRLELRNPTYANFENAEIPVIETNYRRSQPNQKAIPITEDEEL